MSTERLLERAERLVARLEELLPPAEREPDWSHEAYRWRSNRLGGALEPVDHPHKVNLEDLLCMDRQKAEVVRNTGNFVQGRPANNLLLWGSRGTGKSTLVKAVFQSFVEQGLRLIEVDKQDMLHLPDIVRPLYSRPERYLLYCDDLSFEADDAAYKSLKATLEGSIAAPPENVLVYATSNRRHLLPEYQSENREARVVDGELHHGETIEEKISLSERFGLWLSFHPFNQNQYLEIVDHWLHKLGQPGCDQHTTRAEALQWATARGSRSGRVARQFAIDWAGRQAADD